MRNILLLRSRGRLSIPLRVAVLLVYVAANIIGAVSSQHAFAAPLTQQEVFEKQVVTYDVEPCASYSPSSGTAALSGGDNPEKVWNFFKSQGLSDMHVAAIMGSIQQESTFNPIIVEGHPDPNIRKSIPSPSKDPSSLPAVSGWPGNSSKVRQPGWGLVQWTPSNNAVAAAKKYNITTPIFELGTQLQIIWNQMQDTSPTGVSNMVAGLKKTTNISDAVHYFTKNFEGPEIVGNRLTYAQQALQRYGGSGNTGTTTPSSSTSATPADDAGGASCGNGGSTASASSTFGSPDCTQATGTAKILCEAKKYDPVSYRLAGSAGHQGGAAWHKTCPTIGPSCYLDCSGLVNIAVYDAFGADLRENTNSERTSGNWKKIPLSQVQPGDIIQPHDSHVEIIDHVQGSTIFTFGAHTANRAQPGQVGPTSYRSSSGYTYYHYIGPIR